MVRSMCIALIFFSGGHDLAITVDDCLCNVQAILNVFGEAKDDDNLVSCSAFLNLVHLRCVILKRIAHVLGGELRVDRSSSGSSCE